MESYDDLEKMLKTVDDADERIVKFTAEIKEAEEKAKKSRAEAARNSEQTLIRAEPAYDIMSIINRILHTNYVDLSGLLSGADIHNISRRLAIVAPGKRRSFPHRKISTGEYADVMAVRERILDCIDRRRNKMESAGLKLFYEAAEAEKAVSEMRNKITAEESLKRYCNACAERILNQEMPEIRKLEEYSLYAGNRRIARVEENGAISVIATTSKTKPFRIIKKSLYYNPHSSVIPLKAGDFITIDGFKIYDDAKRVAEAIFKKVEEGIEMLPEGDEKQGYRIRERKARTAQGEVETARTWGQDFIASLSPIDRKQGELMGSGGSYIAFFFGNGRVIMEFDQKDRATYLVTREQYDILRHWSREKMLRQRPEGFLGRIIHIGETEEEKNIWADALREYIR